MTPKPEVPEQPGVDMLVVVDGFGIAEVTECAVKGLKAGLESIYCSDARKRL